MDRGQANALVMELGTQLGLNELMLDARGNCLLAIDDGAFLVNLGYNPRGGTIDLMICLDEIVPSGAQLARLLAANFGWTATAGATFALDPASGALVLQRRCAAGDLGHGGLRAALEELVATAEAWAERLAAMPTAGDGAADEAAASDAGHFAMGALRA